MSSLTGEDVVVERREVIGKDAHNAPLYETVTETVHNVIVAPGPRTDIPDTARPAGTVVAWTLHFPKPYAKPLRGAHVRVRGGKPCPVVGDPQPYTAENTPGEWWMPVEASRADG